MELTLSGVEAQSLKTLDRQGSHHFLEVWVLTADCPVSIPGSSTHQLPVNLSVPLVYKENDHAYFTGLV